MSTCRAGWSIVFALVLIAIVAVFTLPWVADGVRNSPPSSAAPCKPSSASGMVEPRMCYTPAATVPYSGGHETSSIATTTTPSPVASVHQAPSDDTVAPLDENEGTVQGIAWDDTSYGADL